ncbi:DUF481 domain-containing protein [Coraliomargarita sp. SDUM461004]|uniref:DUF481 domain-containing protein n=1 Tax=Thalassobacterium sedimentorum TaxID=3041258 RepID=A0ABU1AL73_9BACT|nr:DUF481 domain-containing protein [Coraliomargarita sp. SDUM461004]MDQ8195557.1 DUF481 domain-containing protein [Coraliomargarita sp. SDUM461004]
MRNFLTSFYVLCVWAWAPLLAAPSLVILDTGEQLIGEVLPQSTSETVVLRSEILGEVQMLRSRIVSIEAKQAVTETPAVVVQRKASSDIRTRSEGKPSVKPSELKAEKPAEPKAEVLVATETRVEPLVPEAVLDGVRPVVEKFQALKAPDDWSGSIRLGVNVSQGDTKWAESYANGKLEIDPKQSPNYYRISGSYTFRETERSDGSQYRSTDKYDAEFTYRRTFWNDWFVQNALGYRADQIKGIDREAQETVGVGYHYKPSDTFNILLGGGGGIEEFDADYEDTRAGLNPLANIFQEATWKPFKRTSFVQKFNYYWNPENSEQFNYVFTAAIRVRMTDLLGLEFSYNKSFDNDVGTGSAQDDVQWRNALVVYF